MEPESETFVGVSTIQNFQITNQYIHCYLKSDESYC